MPFICKPGEKKRAAVSPPRRPFAEAPLKRVPPPVFCYITMTLAPIATFS